MTVDHAFYQHSKRPEWGYSAIVEILEDRTTFLFDDGVKRTIKSDHLHMMAHVTLEQGEADEVQRKLAFHARGKPLGGVSQRPGSAAGTKKRTKKAAAPSVP